MKSASEDMWDAWLHEQTSDLFVAAIAYFLSLLIVVFAVSLAQCIVQDETLQMPSANGDLVAALCSWDGYWYISVASQGYTYNPDAVSNIAFFPVFPLLGRVLASLFGVDVPTSLLVASNSCCLAFFWLLVKYCRLRQLSRSATILAVFLVAVFPTGFFLHMAYSESVFLLLCLSAFYCMERRWSVLLVVAICGVATGTRSVGVAILPPVLWYAWSQSRTMILPWRLGTVLAALVISVSGLALFVAFQYLWLGEAFAFMKVQRFWSDRQLTLAESAYYSITMETVHGIYTPGHCCYWADKPPKAFLINYRFVSPIFVFVMLGAAVWGMKQRVVTLAESAYSLVVLLIPLVLQGPRCCFAAQPRYVISAFPIFLAFGIWLALRPSWISLPLVVLSAVVMCVFAALSISWYPIY